MKSYAEEAILGIVAFAAAGTDEIAAPSGAMTIIIFGNSEGGAATAGNKEHSERIAE